MKTLVTLIAPVLLSLACVVLGSDKQDVEAATAAYEKTNARDEAARLSYVTKLAELFERRLKDYWKTGDNHFASATAINQELRKHPAPANSNSKELSRILVGKWQSPRHTYAFLANGKFGIEDSPMSGRWRINGDQLIEENSHGTIILLNADYFIYAEGGDVYFHSRVKE